MGRSGQNITFWSRAMHPLLPASFDLANEWCSGVVGRIPRQCADRVVDRARRRLQWRRVERSPMAGQPRQHGDLVHERGDDRIDRECRQHSDDVDGAIGQRCVSVARRGVAVDEYCSSPTGSPEAVARLRFPRWGLGPCENASAGDLRASTRPHPSSDGYVLIAATSGWTPMIFMTRVKL
jgi:hypothetical protein